MAAGIRDEPLRACLHEGGEPQVGEVTCGGLPHLTCKRDHIKMKDYMDRRVTPPKRVTSPIWGTPPPCKQALRMSAWEATGPSGNHLVSFSLELWYQDSQENKTNCSLGICIKCIMSWRLKQGFPNDLVHFSWYVIFMLKMCFSFSLPWVQRKCFS